MKLFLSPFKPVIYLAAFTVLLLAAPLGRFVFGDGHDWTLQAGGALAVLFALGAAKWPALNQLGASFTRWMNSAALTAVVCALALGIPTAASSIYNQKLMPYYQGYDLFLFTNGADVPWMTTTGEPYVVEYAGQDARSMALTVLLHVVFFLVAAVAGLALGLAYSRYGTGPAFVGALATGVVAVLVYWQSSKVGDQWYSAAGAGVTAACLVALIVSAVVISRTKSFVP